jgi:glutathione S-transferase
MPLLTMDNPVFAAYTVAAALMILKLMVQGWVTVALMIRRDAGLLNPEDLRPTLANRDPRPEQLDPHPEVERSRRMQRNDLESIPAFLAAGLLFVAVDPPASIAYALFTLARLAHTWAYATARNHEVRATFFSIGSIVVILMALWVLLVALF